MKRLYEIIALLGFIVRQFILPNPFECFGVNAFLINLIAEPIIHSVSFALVGLVYHRGDEPALGSFLYLVTYCLIVGVLHLCSIFSFAWWWITTLAVAFIAIICGIRAVCGMLSHTNLDLWG